MYLSTQNLRMDFYIITFVNQLFVSVFLQFNKVCFPYLVLFCLISISGCCISVWFLPLLIFVNLPPFFWNTYLSRNINQCLISCLMSRNINQSSSCTCLMSVWCLVWFLPLLIFLFTACSRNINQSSWRYLNVSVIQSLFGWLGMRGMRWSELRFIFWPTTNPLEHLHQQLL